MPLEPVSDSSAAAPRVGMLIGFYITPFQEKSVKLKFKGADIEKKVNFGKIIHSVTDYFASAEASSDGVLYHFDVKTAENRVRDKYLDESIQKNIDEADFVIVDWTSRNQNVLIEAGYAFGRGKPALDLCADDSVPTDRSGVIYVHYDSDTPEAIPERLAAHLPEIVRQVEAGRRVFDLYDSRTTELVSRMMRQSRTRIQILQTNLETVNTNHLEDLRKALERGVEVQILTLDPQSRYVNERAIQLGYQHHTVKVYRSSLQNSIDNVATLLAPKQGFRMRLYNDFPNQITYLFDNQILACPISRTGRSRENCCFVLPNGRSGGARHTFVEHFEQLWENADQDTK